MIKLIYQSLSLIPKNLISKYYLLFFFILGNVFFDLVSIGLLIPAIAILAGDISNLHPIFQSLLDIFNLNIQNPNLILIFVAIAFLFKTIFFLLFNWLKFSTTTLIVSDLSKKLTQIYLNKKIIFFLDKNSSELIRNCTSEIARFNKNIILASLNLISDILIVIFITILIFYIEFKVSSLVLLFVLLFFGSYFLFFKSKINMYGRERQLLEKYRLKNAQTLFQGIRLIKIFAKENNFVNIFFKNVFKLMNYDKKINLIVSIPRQLIEFLSVIIFLTTIYLLLYFSDEKNFISVLPTLTLFVVGFIRIAPSFNRILLHAQLINSSISTINLLSKEFNEKKINAEDENNNNEYLNIKGSIVFKNLSFKYKNRDNPVFKNLNLTIPTQRIIGIIGKSGSGKSTFLDILMGLIECDEGKVTINGENIIQYKKQWRENIAYIPQENYIFDASINENIAVEFDKDKINYQQIELAASVSMMDEFVAKFPDKYETEIGEKGSNLSGGQTQRIALARGIYRNPKIYILDEFTNALDKETEKILLEKFLQFAKEKTIFLSTHNKDLLNICNEVYEIKNFTLNKIK